jgi:hypothetical protein
MQNQDEFLNFNMFIILIKTCLIFVEQWLNRTKHVK